MTAIARSVFDGEISDRLSAPLRLVARRSWIADAAVAGCKTAVCALGCLLAVVLLLGYFQNLWMPVRIFFSLVGWAGVVYSAVRFLRPVMIRRSIAQAAHHVERDQPGLHERLSSAVSLGSRGDAAFRGSPGLLSHLFHQAETDADAVKPGKVVPFDRVIRWAILLAPVVICWTMLAIVPASRHTTLAGLYRVLMPWKSSLPAMLMQVLVKPGDVTLVQGDAMDVTVHVSAADRDANHATLIRKFDSGQMFTDPMEPAGSSRDFAFHLSELQQSFTYRVSTGQGDSAWFTATIHPRPQIEDLEVRCVYPAYTGLAPTVTTGRDGAISAIVGTQVTLTVHTALPIAVDKSHIVIQASGGEQSAVPPVGLLQPDANMPDYQAQFVVKTSGQYRVNLTNEFGLTNTDDHPHEITAIADEVPSIIILSPEQRITVGADDIVPVKFIAKDDFGVAKIEAVLQVGDGAAQTIPQTVPVEFTTADKRVVKGSAFSLNVGDLLKTAGTNRVESITYQLKVTDNRDPNPQVGFSNRQMLKIDQNGSQDFAAKEDQKLAQDLKQAIERAIRELSVAQMQIQPSRDFDAHQSMDEWRRKQLSEGAAGLPRISKALSKAADDAKDTVFDAIADQVKQIVENKIAPAADDAAQADLNADKGSERHDAAARSVTGISDARDQLQKLLASQAIDKALHQTAAARDLADAAQKQQEAADLMKTPQELQQQPRDHQVQEQQRQAMHRQEQANRKLNEAMQQSEALRDPQAQETARELQDLIHKVDQTQKQQEAAEQQTEKQKAAADIQQDANAVARDQEALNQEIAKSAEQNKQEIKQANANPPGADQQQNIVKSLDKNQLENAHNQMDQAAGQLRREQEQLENLAKSKDLHPTDQQRDAIGKDQHEVEQAQKASDAARDAANELKQAQKQGDTDAGHAAEKIEKLAQDMKPSDVQAKQDAADAEKHAKAAEQAANQAAHADAPDQGQKDQGQKDQGQKDQAQNNQAQNNHAQKDRAQAMAELQQAAKALNDAALENAQADKAAMVQQQQKAAEAAADQATHQAEKQQELAQQVKDQQRALAKVQNAPPADQAAEQERHIEDQTKGAKKDAEQLEQQAQRKNDAGVEARAKNAQMHLAEAQEHQDKAAAAQQQAAKHQQEAADAHNAQQAQAAEQKADQDLDQAGKQEQQAQAAIAKARDELQNAPAQANAQGKQTQSQQAAQAAQEAAQAQQDASQQNPVAARQAARALAKAAQAMAKAAQPGQPGQNEPGQENQQASRQSKKPGMGRSDDPKEGASLLSGLPISLPASVLDMGISADQWAVLPPLVKKDLINAAQQSGPPAYRQMMREYFAKVAKMQGDPGGQ